MALYTKAELAKQTVAELRTLAEDHGLEFDDKPTKVQSIAALMKLTEEDALVEDEADDEVEELDDEVDDEEVDDEEANDELPAEDDEELDDEELDEEEIDEVVVEPKKRTAKAAATKPAKAKASTAGEGDTLAAKQVATMLNTEAKTLRQFLRSPASTFEPVGSGGRYEFTEGDVPQIKQEFDAWRAAHAARGSKRTTGKSSTPSKPIEEVEEVEEIEELDDELDDEDLELDD